MKELNNLNKLKIYSIDYLINNELTDQDISNLLDNKHLGLKASLIVGMFKFIKSKKRTSQILKMISTDNSWINKNVWTKTQHDEYEKLVIDAYRNVFQYNGLQAVSLGQWFMTIYGISVEGNKIDLRK